MDVFWKHNGKHERLELEELNINVPKKKFPLM